jgi:O-antigen/teichoic acid export membrane protein
MSLSQKVARNTATQIIGKGISTILGLLAMAIIARYLGASGFGTYTTIFTFISFFAIIADFGLTLVTAQMISEPGADENKLLSNLLSIRLLSAIVFLGLGPIAVMFFPYSHEIKIGVLILSASFLFVALNQVLMGLFQKQLTTGKAVLADIVSRIVFLIGTYITAVNNLGLETILIVSVIASAVSFIIQLLCSRKTVDWKLECDWTVWKNIWKKSWPLAVTIAFNLIYLKADTLILSLIKDPTEVGLYGSAYKIIDILVTVPFMFAGVILPILTADFINKNTVHLNKVMARGFDFMIIMALPLIVGTQFLAKNIMVIVAGKEFAPAGIILQMLIVAAAIIFLSCLFSHLIIAVNRQKKMIGSYVFTAITALIGYLIFIPKYSYFGAAGVTIYSELCILIFSIYYSKKYADISIKWKTTMKALLSSVIMGVFLFFIPASFSANLFGLLLTILGASLLYFLSLYILKAISRNDLPIWKKSQ